MSVLTCMEFFAVTRHTDRWMEGRTDDKNIDIVGLCTLVSAGFFCLLFIIKQYNRNYWITTATIVKGLLMILLLSIHQTVSPIPPQTSEIKVLPSQSARWRRERKKGKRRWKMEGREIKWEDPSTWLCASAQHWKMLMMIPILRYSAHLLSHNFTN